MEAISQARSPGCDILAHYALAAMTHVYVRFLPQIINIDSCLLKLKLKMLSFFLTYSVYLITVALLKIFDNDMMWLVTS